MKLEGATPAVLLVELDGGAEKVEEAAASLEALAKTGFWDYAEASFPERRSCFGRCAAAAARPCSALPTAS
jgi:hypothetical protein